MSGSETKLRLSDLSRQIQEILKNKFKDLQYWVVADIMNHNFKEKSNYHYFDLVEKAEDSNQLLAKIKGKAWKDGSARIFDFERITGQRFTNNINVLVRVKVDYHPVFGIALDVIDVDPNFTIGLLEQQKQATLEQLVLENPGVVDKIGDRYVTKNGRLALPRVIQRIAVVASKTSAGNEDFRHTLTTNPYGYKFDIHDYHAIVQNDDNAQLFVDRLVDVYNSGIPFDAVVINRGGGSDTDFLIFNNYKVARAVARFPIPIITGIGHLKNVTITDLMANTQTKTPTEAAEFIITHNKQFEDELLNLQKTVLIKSQQVFSNNYQTLTTLNSSLVNKARTLLNTAKDALVVQNQLVVNGAKTILFQHRNSLSFIASGLLSKPRIITGNKSNDLANIVRNLSSFKNSFLRNQRGYLGHYVSIIRLMAPENILKKGFAIVKFKGDIVTDPAQLQLGAEMEVQLKDQLIKSQIISKTKKDGSEYNL